MRRVILFVLTFLIVCVIGCTESKSGGFTRQCAGRMTEAKEREFRELTPCGPHVKGGVTCRSGCRTLKNPASEINEPPPIWVPIEPDTDTI